MPESPLLSVEGLSKSFAVKSQGRTQKVHAVRGVSFCVLPGRTLALVGESGCGKTTTGRLVLRLIEPDAGIVQFGGQDVSKLAGSALKQFRSEAQIVFQDPASSLNPRMSIGSAISEPLLLHGTGKSEASGKLAELLSAVELPLDFARRYPHELSGGQRQRVAIARALALEPKLIVADEPVSALDASIQSQILNLLARLQAERGLTFLFISHDLAVVRHLADEVAVMYLGQIVEQGPVDAIFESAQHPYTQALLSAVPEPVASARRVSTLAGSLPSAAQIPPGCSFASRCPLAFEQCKSESPPLFPAGEAQLSRCWLNKHGARPLGA